jgi:hypothetical protein
MKFLKAGDIIKAGSVIIDGAYMTLIIKDIVVKEDDYIQFEEGSALNLPKVDDDVVIGFGVYKGMQLIEPDGNIVDLTYDNGWISNLKLETIERYEKVN